MQRPVEDQPRHLTQVRLPRPGLTERLLGKGAAGGAVQRGDRHRLLGGQEGQSVLQNQQLQPHAVLQRRARLRTSVGPHRHLRPHEGGPAAWWVIQRNDFFYKMMFTGIGQWPLYLRWGRHEGLSSTLDSSEALCANNAATLKCQQAHLNRKKSNMLSSFLHWTPSTSSSAKMGVLFC